MDCMKKNLIKGLKTLQLFIEDKIVSKVEIIRKVFEILFDTINKQKRL